MTRWVSTRYASVQTDLEGDKPVGSKVDLLNHLALLPVPEVKAGCEHMGVSLA